MRQLSHSRPRHRLSERHDASPDSRVMDQAVTQERAAVVAALAADDQRHRIRYADRAPGRWQ